MSFNIGKHIYVLLNDLLSRLQRPEVREGAENKSGGSSEKKRKGIVVVEDASPSTQLAKQGYIPNIVMIERMRSYFEDLGDSLALIPKQFVEEATKAKNEAEDDELAKMFEDSGDLGSNVPTQITERCAWSAEPEDSPVKVYQWPVNLIGEEIGVAFWCLPHVYLFATSEFLSLRANNNCFADGSQLSPELCAQVLSLTSSILLISPDHHTSWTCRKQVIQRLVEQAELLDCTVSVPGKEYLLKELNFLNTLFLMRPKASDAWSHRRWLLRKIASKMCYRYEAEEPLVPSWREFVAILIEEFKVCEAASLRYPRNYYSWSHAQWSLQELTSIWHQLEADFRKSHGNGRQPPVSDVVNIQECMNGFDLSEVYFSELKRISECNLNYVGDHCAYHHRIHVLKQCFNLRDPSILGHLNTLLIGYDKVMTSRIGELPRIKAHISSVDNLNFTEILVAWTQRCVNRCKNIPDLIVRSIKSDVCVPFHSSKPSKPGNPKRAHADHNDILEDINTSEHDEASLSHQEKLRLQEITKEVTLQEMDLIRTLPHHPDVCHLRALMESLDGHLVDDFRGDLLALEWRWVSQLEELFPGHESLWMARRHLCDIIFESALTRCANAITILGVLSMSLMETVYAWAVVKTSKERKFRSRPLCLSYQKHVIFHALRIANRYKAIIRDSDDDFKEVLLGALEQLTNLDAKVNESTIFLWPQRGYIQPRL